MTAPWCGHQRRGDVERLDVGADVVEHATGGNCHPHAGSLHIGNRCAHHWRDAVGAVEVENGAVEIERDKIEWAVGHGDEGCVVG